jgi:hypothetical protein
MVLFCLGFLILLPFGNGGLEGDQRNLMSLERSDNWNFIVPFVYGQWPDFLGSWKTSLTVFQLLLFWLGMYLIFKDFQFDRLSAYIFFILFYVSTFFTANLFRDASLFALSALGIGFVFEASRRKSLRKYLYFSAGIVCLLLASMFKPFYSLILSLVLLNAISVIFSIKPRDIFKLVPVPVLILIFSFTINNILSESFKLRSVYPEQQPIIMDLSAQYCWGTDPEQIAMAGNALKGLVKDKYPLRSLCSSLRPNSWDNLHNYPEKWQYSSPIKRITNEGNKDESDKLVSELINRWISLIITHPVDWLQVRLYFLGPTLFASNSFTANIVSQTPDVDQHSYLSKTWNLLLAPALALDKLRVTSIGFGLFILTFFYTNYRNNTITNEANKIKIRLTLLISLITLIMTLIFGTLISVANNGRYFLPYILLTFFIVIRSRRTGCNSS